MDGAAKTGRVGGKKLNCLIGKKVWLAHIETSIQSPFKTMVSPLLQISKTFHLVRRVTCFCIAKEARARAPAT